MYFRSKDTALSLFKYWLNKVCWGHDIWNAFTNFNRISVIVVLYVPLHT